MRLSGNSDKRFVRLVSALRGEAKADAGHIMAIFIADFRTRLQACSLVGNGGGYMYSSVSCIQRLHDLHRDSMHIPGDTFSHSYFDVLDAMYITYLRTHGFGSAASARGLGAR